MHYHSNEYDAEHIERIAAYYAGALQAIASQPQQAYLSCMLMSAEEALLLQQIGQGEQRPLPEEGMIQRILAQAEECADKPALQDEKHALNYSQFAQQCRTLALHLAGVGGQQRQQVIAVSLPRSVGGSWQWRSSSGNVYMPLMLLPELLNEGQVTQVVCDAEQTQRLSGSLPG